MRSSLSGGQKQRLLLARTLYKSPMILFLDGATSHLDVNTERKINSIIGGLNLTRVIIADRSETIRSTNRIVEMKNENIFSDCDQNSLLLE